MMLTAVNKERKQI